MTKVSVDEQMMTMAAAFVLGMANDKDHDTFQADYDAASSTEELNFVNMMETIQKGGFHFCLSASVLNTIQAIFHELYHHSECIGVRSDGNREHVGCEDMVRSCTREIVEHMLTLIEANEKGNYKGGATIKRKMFEFTDSKGRPVKF